MNITRLSQAYDFPGFKALTRIQELPENRASVVITLKRKYQKKSQNVQTVVPEKPVGTTTRKSKYETIPVDIFGYILNLMLVASSARSAGW